MWSKVLLICFVECLVNYSAFTMPYADEQLYEGSNCMLETGDNGLCKKLTECPSRLEEVRQGRRNWYAAGRCGFENFVEIVCCPVNITDKIGLRPAEIACQQYDNEIMTQKEEADVTFHIFGGEETQSGEFPHMAALGYENRDDDEDASPIKYNCGGTLISSEHVLTAAHCVDNVHGKVPIEVRLGSIDLKSTEPTVQRIPIDSIVSHPRFKRSAMYNDIAILKLRTKAQLSNSVWPICLQTKSLESIDVVPNASLVVIGWGSTSFDNDGSQKLMRTPGLSIMDRRQCGKSYSGFLKLPKGLDENMICARDKNSSRRSDACQGDSGGPLLMLSKSGDTIVGITSFGQTCGGPVPGVYTAIYSFLDWIEEQVWKTDLTD